jgi:hypothetical protein
LSGTYNIRLKAYGSGYVDSSSTTVNVTPSPSPLIVRAGTTLSIIGGPYTGYQWYNGASLIAGATSSSYVFSSPSVYTVVVDSAGCKGTSNSENTLSVNSLSANTTAYWVAQSGSDRLYVYSQYATDKDMVITVNDISGRTITSKKWVSGTSSTSVDVSELNQGMYFIKLHNDIAKHTIKWVKK